MICEKCNIGMSEGLMTKWGDICNQCAIWFAQEQMARHKDEIEAFVTHGDEST